MRGRLEGERSGEKLKFQVSGATGRAGSFRGETGSSGSREEDRAARRRGSGD